MCITTMLQKKDFLKAIYAILVLLSLCSNLHAQESIENKSTDDSAKEAKDKSLDSIYPIPPPTPPNIDIVKALKTRDTKKIQEYQEYLKKVKEWEFQIGVRPAVARPEKKLIEMILEDAPLLGARYKDVRDYYKKYTNVEDMRIEQESPGDDGKVTAIKFTLFDKGASSTFYRTSKGRANLKQLLEDTEEEITEKLGEPEITSLGRGNLRVRAKEWKCKDKPFKFILTHKVNEYAQLHIVYDEERYKPDLDNKVADSKNGDPEGLTRYPNGDVVLNVPMVNQGSRGYCAPATLERVFRYYKITDVDMHNLADIFNTGLGGGTYTRKAIPQLNSLARKYNLVCKIDDLDFYRITRYIDEGTPLAWLMYASAEFLQYSSSQRALHNIPEFQTNLKDWRNKCKTRHLTRSERKKDDAHLCLIVGYNKDTREIAISHSSGYYEVVDWATFKSAQLVNRAPGIIAIIRR